MELGAYKFIEDMFDVVSEKLLEHDKRKQKRKIFNSYLKNDFITIGLQDFIVTQIDGQSLG
jgi:hypothetical protein